MRRIGLQLCVVLPLLLATPLQAQMVPAPSEAEASVGVVRDPCAVNRPPPETSSAYGAWKVRDFANQCRYAQANAALPPATAHRVVFLGDSITEAWIKYDPELFSNDVLDRGIGGQTTDQIVGRFQQDVVALHPAVVHILAGTNDIAGNTGPTSLARIEANIQTMVELAKVHHIRVILAAVIPVTRYGWRPEVQAPPQISALNAWLKAYAQTEGVEFVDYGTVLTDGGTGIRSEVSGDGVHPNTLGYRLMRPLFDKALAKLLRP